MWVLFSSGTGPGECEIACYRLANIFANEAIMLDIQTSMIDNHATSNGLLSALLSVEGDKTEDFVRTWEGTIKWICESSIRKNWKRKNWFVSVSVIRPPTPAQEIKSSDLRIDTFRSSGPGGQNLQKTDSAVRITHIPTGLITQAQEERSQTRNKSLALARMVELLELKSEKETDVSNKERWMKHNTLERGNPIRIYQGEDFKPKHVVKLSPIK